jgi:hypothetical protein
MEELLEDCKPHGSDIYGLNPLTQMIKNEKCNKVEITALINHLMAVGKLATSPLEDICLGDAYNNVNLPSSYVKNLAVLHDKKDWDEEYLYLIQFIANTLNEGELYLHLMEVTDYVRKKKDKKESILTFCKIIGIYAAMAVPFIALAVIGNILHREGEGEGGLESPTQDE